MKRDYLSRLSRVARWRLGAKEAGEVIADYREIVGDPPRPEEELVRDLGRPLDAVKPLTDQKAYRLWLAVFAVLAVCLAFPGLSAPWGTWKDPFSWLFHAPWGNWKDPFSWLFHVPRARVPALLGVVLALVWFRRKGEKRGGLPRAVPVLLAILAAGLAVVLAADWAWMHDPEKFSAMWGKMAVDHIGDMRLDVPILTSRSFSLLGKALTWGGGLGTTAVGIFSLVKARMEDRRWTAVYVLAMTGMLVALESLGVLSNMDISYGPAWKYLSAYFHACTALTALGLIGTGVALC